jgi:GLPGLI family protein
MKNKFIVTVFFLQFICCIVNAQDIKTLGKIDYDMILVFGNSSNYKSSLIFNNTISEFRYSNLQQEDIKTKDENNNWKIQYADTTSNQVVLNRLTSKIYNYKRIGYSKNYLWIEESTPTLEWILAPETKKIGTLLCNKATTTFRGRSYTAWYTPEIKNSLGPWKLQGLPGMILEAYDDKREVSFLLKKISIPFNAFIAFDVKVIKTITHDEEKVLVEKEKQDLLQKFQASLPRGLTGKISFAKPDIEINQ